MDTRYAALLRTEYLPDLVAGIQSYFFSKAQAFQLDRTPAPASDYLVRAPLLPISQSSYQSRNQGRELGELTRGLYTSAFPKTSSQAAASLGDAVYTITSSAQTVRY